MRFVSPVFLALLICLGVVATLVAVPLSPEVVQGLRERGELENAIALFNDAHRRGLSKPTLESVAALKDRGVTGQRSAVVILVDFDDNEADTVHYPRGYYQEMLFSVGTFSSGSMRDYYHENSYDQLDLTGVVVGWYRAPEDYSYYTNNSYGFSSYPRNAQGLTEVAVLAADPYVDFSQFDNDGPDGNPNSGDDDGFVDALFVVHAGPGAESTGNLDDIWSHMWVTAQYIQVDGVYVFPYSMEPETGKIGVFSHELGHVFGLPDLYDYDYDSDGVGYWSIMAAGSWANGGRTPVHFDAWCKTMLGWLEPIEPSEDVGRISLPQVEDSPIIYKLWREGQATNEYFLVENRQKVRFDGYLRGTGLLIYHVDDYVWSNDNQWYPGCTDYGHYQVAVEQADGEFDLEQNRGADSGDPWPGSTDNTTFDKRSLPSTDDYYGNFTHVAVEDISLSDSLMWATIRVEPAVEYVAHAFNDDRGGDGDGLAEAGESVDLVVTVVSYRSSVVQLEARLRSNDPQITMEDSVSIYPPLSQGATGVNVADPFTIRVGDMASVHNASLSMNIFIDGGMDTTTDEFQILVGHPSYLLVDDDGWEHLESYYAAALDTLGKLSLLWDRSANALPSGFLEEFDVVIWLTGRDSTTSLIPEDQANIENYLENGGNLFVTGQGIGYDLVETGSSEDSAFYADYLNVRFLSNTSAGCDGLRGVSGDAISGDFASNLLIISGSGGANNQLSPSVIAPANGAVTIFNYIWGPFGTSSDSTGAAVRHEGVGRVVYFAFGFEGIADKPDRILLMDRIMKWMEEGSWVEDLDWRGRMPLGFSLAQNFPNPFNPETVIEYTLPEKSQVSLIVYNVLGQEVRRLVNGLQSPGYHGVVWDGSDDGGQAMATGVYLYRLKAGEYGMTKRMVLMR